MLKFIVLDRCAKMPTSVWHPYRKVAVIETDGTGVPSYISTRHRAVIRIVKLWDRLCVGKTDRCAYRQALIQAKALANELNASIASVTK